MTGMTAEAKLPRATPFPRRPGPVPTGGMDRIIQRTCVQENGRWVAFAVLAAVCTVALLSVNRNAPQIVRINEGRIVVSTVRQGEFDDFTPMARKCRHCAQSFWMPSKVAVRRSRHAGAVHRLGYGIDPRPPRGGFERSGGITV